MKICLKFLVIFILSIIFITLGTFALAFLLVLLENSIFSLWYKSVGIGGEVTLWQIFLIAIFSISLSIEIGRKVFK